LTFIKNITYLCVSMEKIAMLPLKKEFDFYLKNQKEFVEKYNGKHLVIVGENVENVFDSAQDAYIWAVDKFGLGNFFIQFCSPGESAYTINIFTTRAIFA